MRHVWRRLLCQLSLHTFEWRYSEDRSERWRACHYCGHERPVGVRPVGI